jgi:peptidoglycan/xylan/chitin deacetylase (PgdA/CDA1 family)
VTPEVTLDWNLLCVTPGHLASQLEWLRRRFDLVSMKDLLKPRRARPRVALTFDDGYADNLLWGLAVLEQFSAPATVFVSSGQIGADGEFWWDELERLLFLAPSLPREVAVQRPMADQVWRRETLRDRGILYREVFALIKPLRWNEQQEVLAQLRRQFVGVPAPRSTHRALSRDELVDLATSPLISIGGHTVHHCSLASRPEAEQEEEIRVCLETLRVWTGQRVDSFSYPFGTGDDIGPLSKSYVARNGCVMARANEKGLVAAKFDRFRLPGLLVRNWPVAVFQSRLTHYLQTGGFDGGLG